MRAPVVVLFMAACGGAAPTARSVAPARDPACDGAARERAEALRGEGKLDRAGRLLATQEARCPADPARDALAKEIAGALDPGLESGDALATRARAAAARGDRVEAQRSFDRARAAYARRYGSDGEPVLLFRAVDHAEKGATLARIHPGGELAVVLLDAHGAPRGRVAVRGSPAFWFAGPEELVVVDGAQATIHDTASFSATPLGPARSLLATTADGRLAVLGDQGGARVVDVRARETLGTIAATERADFLQGGKYLLAGSDVYALPSLRKTLSLRCARRTTAPSPRETTIAEYCHDPPSLALWDVATGKRIFAAPFHLPAFEPHLAVSGDDTTIAVAISAGAVSFLRKDGRVRDAGKAYDSEYAGSVALTDDGSRACWLSRGTHASWHCDVTFAGRTGARQDARRPFVVAGGAVAEVDVAPFSSEGHTLVDGGGSGNVITLSPSRARVAFLEGVMRREADGPRFGDVRLVVADLATKRVLARTRLPSLPEVNTAGQYGTDVRFEGEETVVVEHAQDGTGGIERVDAATGSLVAVDRQAGAVERVCRFGARLVPFDVCAERALEPGVDARGRSGDPRTP